MKQQTAVEWLADEIIMLEERLRQGKVKFIDFFDFKDILVEQAKEIQFQQMKKSYYTGLSSELHDYFEKYYEDTYGTVNENERA